MTTVNPHNEAEARGSKAEVGGGIFPEIPVNPFLGAMPHTKYTVLPILESRGHTNCFIDINPKYFLALK